ncbi:MAG: dockerin type I repeat-containing protein [Ruminococcus sp.]|nr:dockerin type I repeat-containing protein [Ruminococcus sp.]
MKKKIVSALMAVAMCVSAMPVSVYAEDTATAEMPEFTQKFFENCLLNPDESEENRLIHNVYKSFYKDEDKIFLGIQQDSSRPYYITIPKSDATVPHHGDIKCIQYISQDNYISLYDYIENPYITEADFNALTYDEKVQTYGKILEETGAHIAGWISTELAIFPCYYIGEDGKCYSYKGAELDIFNDKVKSIYIQPDEFKYVDYLNIYDGKSVYKYTDVYTGSLNKALRADYYKYIEDNNAQEVFHRITCSEVDVYRTKDRGWNNYVEDLSDELIITDKNGNVIPNDPNLLQMNQIWNSFVYVYKVDDRYIFEDEDGNRITLSDYDDSRKNNFEDDEVVEDFFRSHSISESLRNEELNTVHVAETYVAETDSLIKYNTETLIGDANEDDNITLADAVLIMQSISNPDGYTLTEQGVINADFNGDGTVSAMDALEIQTSMIS